MSVNLTTFRGRVQTTQKLEKCMLNRACERAWNGDMPLRAYLRTARTGRCRNDILLYRGMDNAGSEAHLVTTSDWPIATVAQEMVFCQLQITLVITHILAVYLHPAPKLIASRQSGRTCWERV